MKLKRGFIKSTFYLLLAISHFISVHAVEGGSYDKIEQFIMSDNRLAPNIQLAQSYIDVSDITPASIDITPPSIDITTLSVEPKEAQPGDTVKISAKVEDDISGVKAVTVYYSMPISNKSKEIVLSDKGNNLYEGVFELDEFPENGLWQINYIRLLDNEYNKIFIYNQNLRYSGVMSSEDLDLSAGDFTVKSTTQDIIPPSIDITTLSVSRKEATPDNKIKISVQVEDELSRIATVTLYYRTPITNNRERVVLYDEGDNLYEGVIDFDEFLELPEVGLWEIEYISAADNQSNRVDIYNRNLGYNGDNDQDLSAGDFTLTLENYDMTPPSIDITTLSVEPKEAQSGDTVKMRIKIEDDVSGVDYASVDYKCISSSEYIITELRNQGNNIYEAVFKLDENNYATGGLWQIEKIFLLDKKGHIREIYNKNLGYNGDNDQDLNAGNFTVADTTAPKLALNGDKMLTVEAGTTYEELGAGAFDLVDGELEVTIEGEVNTKVLGTYTVTYTATDSSGNVSQIERKVTVVDTTAPNITLNGDEIVTVEAGTTYEELGAKATDSVDGELAVTIEGEVNTKVLGAYTITYTATDSSGNVSQIERKVTVVDTTAPNITLNGDEIVTVEAGTTYEELGAKATDSVDGELEVTIEGEVNTKVLGTYTVTYTATDSSGNVSQIERKVTVVDTTAPVITLNGDSSITVELGTTYEELGAKATDSVDGELEVTINGEVNTKVLGTYIVTYTATDSSGNVSQIERKVTIVDTTAPNITLNGDEIVTVEAGTTYEELGAKATDSVDGDLEVTIDGEVNTKVLGTYTVTYTATDSSGNVSKIERKVTVVDTTAPVITLNGDSSITIELGTTYEELGAKAIDAIDGELVVTINGEVNTNILGTYTVTYTATDSSGNVSQIERKVTIVDTTAPNITLNGDEIVTVEAGTTYEELGAKATDSVDRELEVTIDGEVNTKVLGTYTVTYTATDSSGNVGQMERKVIVVDTTAPVITLNGDEIVTVEAGTTYEELGAKATDSVDGDLEVTIDGEVNTKVLGTYVVTYTATDSSGNVSQIERKVTVVDTTAPVITLNGDSSITVELGMTYEELGAKATDSVDGDLEVTIDGEVNTKVLGTYLVTYTATDSSGNISKIERKVTVIYAKEDLNEDGVINEVDLGLLSSMYGLTTSDDNFKEKYDLNKDGIIDLYDLVLVSSKIQS